MKCEFEADGWLGASPKAYIQFNFQSEEEYQALVKMLTEHSQTTVLQTPDKIVTYSEGEERSIKRASKGTAHWIPLPPTTFLASILQQNRFFRQRKGLRRHPTLAKMIVYNLETEIISSVNAKRKAVNLTETEAFY